MATVTTTNSSGQTITLYVSDPALVDHLQGLVSTGALSEVHVEGHAQWAVGEEGVLNADAPEPPTPSANKPEWVAHAVALGLDQGTAEAMTKAELVKAYKADA